MAEGIELGKAYVQIIPSATGIKGKLVSLLGGEAGSAGGTAGKRFSGTFGNVLKAGGRVAFNGLVGAGKLALKGLSGASKLTIKGISAGIKGLATGIGTAIGAGVRGVASLAKQAVDAYAEFEQLEGGVKTLFGDEAAKTVMQNANAAFSTAGISANEYMETAIQSSAAMVAALKGDQAKAAELVDMSIIDMADNVNKMGTSMESVQNAYRGFSRGNFSMLDNLALGYAGTKGGMEKLLEDARKISGVKYNIDSYADIVQAIHVVQENMGIAGATAEEAAGTISGSLGAMKASWQNLIAGLANGDADIESLTQQFAGSVTTVAKNLVPVIKTALRGIGELVKELAPIIEKELPGLLKELLPGLTATIASLAISLGTVLAQSAPEIIGTLLDALVRSAPVLLDGAVSLVRSMVTGLISLINGELPGLLKDFLPGLIKTLVDLAVSLGIALAENAPAIIEMLLDALVENAPVLLEGAVHLVIALVTGLAKSLPKILMAGVQLIGALLDAIVESLPEIIEAGISLVTGLWDGISSAAEWLWDQISGWLGGIWGGIKGFFGIASPSKEMAWAGEMLAEGLASGITDSAEDAVSAATRMSADVLSAMNGGEYALTANGAASMELRHSGTIRVEGVNSQGELVGVTELLYDQIVARLRREARYA